VVLVAARNPLNIGAAARAMSNFGFSSLRVVNPFDVAFREAKSAVGAASLLASAAEHKTVADAVADCSLVVGTTAARNRELRQPLHALAAGARLIRDHLASGRVALLFGSEKRGLSNEDLSHCDWLLRIPTREDHPSMNLGQAVAVCLYELSRQPLPASSAAKTTLSKAGERERVASLLFALLRDSGYVKRGGEAAMQEKLRLLLRRLRMEQADAELLLGMLRKIAWKLDR